MTIIKTAVFSVIPINFFQDEIRKKSSVFSYSSWILNPLCAKMEFNSKMPEEAKMVELIHYTPGTVESVLREIDEGGFIPAPPQYLLGLIVQNPEIMKEFIGINSFTGNSFLDKETSEIIEGIELGCTYDKVRGGSPTIGPYKHTGKGWAWIIVFRKD